MKLLCLFGFHRWRYTGSWAWNETRCDVFRCKRCTVTKQVRLDLDTDNTRPGF